MNGWVKTWITDIVEDTLQSYIEDEYIADCSVREYMKVLNKVLSILFDDSDLETEIINLIRQEVDTIYFEDVKPELEGGWYYDGENEN